ncbi:Ermin, partial [Opisthocomus hoazin]
CNGSVPPEKGPLQLIGIVDEIAKSVGTGPYANAETSPDAPLAKENLEETRNSLAEDVMRGDFDGEKQCEGKREENAGTLQQGAAEIQDAGADGHESEEGNDLGRLSVSNGRPQNPSSFSAWFMKCLNPPGAQVPSRKLPAPRSLYSFLAGARLDLAPASCGERGAGGVLAAHPGSTPGCNSQAEKLGEQPSLGKKNDISRHSYSRYNTISYRRIRKGNTK